MAKMILKNRRPIVLFNCTTDNVGGGMKNSALFIIETLYDTDSFEWRYAISLGVAELLKAKNITLDNRFEIFDISPAQNLKMRKRLCSLSVRFNTVLVYSMAGPAYVKFPMLHVLGISNPYVSHARIDVLKIYSGLFIKLKLILRTFYQLYSSKKADYFIFQTETARSNFCKRTRINLSRTEVISNAFDSQMQCFFTNRSEPSFRKCKMLNIFCPGAAYVHKAFQLVPEIIDELNKLGNFKYKFTITLPKSNLLNDIMRKAYKMGIEDYINNIGPFSYNDILELYSKADVVFVPSLLETFSASYLEAISANKILVVADKDFAKEVCQDYAIYVNPLVPYQVAKQFQSIFEEPIEYLPDSKKGESLLNKFGDQKQRYNKIIKFLKSKLDEIELSTKK
jgi:glycosyltransferase involved in cell wall biosynthesis